MLRRRRPALIVVTCLSAVVHAGQMSHQNPPPPVVCHELELDPPGPNEFYTGTSALDIDGDCIMDVAYLIGSRVEVLLAPGLYEALMTNVADGRDIAVCERAGRDDLLVVGAAGLSRVAWNEAGAIEADFWSTTPLAADEWCDVTVLRTWSRDASSVHVAGLHSNGKWILRGRLVGTVWFDADPIEVPPVVTDFDLVDWDGEIEVTHLPDARAPEIACRTASTVFVWDPEGDPVLVGIWSTDVVVPTRIARIRQAGWTREWVATLATSVMNGQQYLVATGAGDPPSIAALGSSYAFTTLGTGDFDGDGSDDAVMSSAASWQLAWARNAGGGAGPAAFAASNLVVRSTGATGSAAGNQATPAVADLDGDSDADVAFPQLASSTMWVFQEPSIHSGSQRPTLRFEESIGSPAVGARVDSGQRLSFLVEPPVVDAGDHLEVVAWRVPSAASPILDSTPVTTQRFDLAFVLAGDVVPVEFVVPGGPSLVDSSGNPSTLQSIVYVVLQTFDLDTSGDPVWRYPALAVVIEAQGSGNGTTPNALFVAEHGNELAFDVFTGFAGASSFQGGGADGQDVGSGSDVLCLPAPINDPPRR